MKRELLVILVLFVICLCLGLISVAIILYLKETPLLKGHLEEYCNVTEEGYLREGELWTFKISCIENDYRCFKGDNVMSCVKVGEK